MDGTQSIAASGDPSRVGLSFGSLFAGIGGIDLGLERAGMTCKWQVEIDDYARQVLEKHWPNVQRWDDVRSFPPCFCKECRPFWEVDLIAGGFPCQDISYAGKGAGLDGERSGLWWEFARIICVVGPRYVLVENVAAMLVRGLDAVLGTLGSFGYDAEWQYLPASAFGARHFRGRLFVVGWHRSTSNTNGERCYVSPQRHGEIRLPIGLAQKKVRFPELSESAICRPSDGVPARVDRLRCLGNAVVPQVAEWIGRRIAESWA